MSEQALRKLSDNLSGVWAERKSQSEAKTTHSVGYPESLKLISIPDKLNNESVEHVPPVPPPATSISSTPVANSDRDFEDQISGLTMRELFVSNHERFRKMGQLAELRDNISDQVEKERIEAERDRIGNERIIVKKRYRQLSEQNETNAESLPVASATPNEGLDLPEVVNKPLQPEAIVRSTIDVIEPPQVRVFQDDPVSTAPRIYSDFEKLINSLSEDELTRQVAERRQDLGNIEKKLSQTTGRQERTNLESRRRKLNEEITIIRNRLTHLSRVTAQANTPSNDGVELPTALNRPRIQPPTPVGSTQLKSASVCLSSSEITLGTDVATNQPVTLAGESKDLGLYMIGAPGVGKSALMLNMILQDISQGNGACILDPHGDLINDILDKTTIDPSRIILLDPTDWNNPFGLNLFACNNVQDPTARARTTSYVMGIFEKLWGPDGLHPSWGAQLEDILRHVTQAFVQAQEYTLADVPLFLEDEQFRAKVISKLSPQVQDYWERSYNPRKDQLNYRASTLNKVRKFTDDEILYPILGQSKSTINFSQVMDQGKILLVPLAVGKIGDEAVSLLGSLIVGQLLQATLARAEKPQSQRSTFSLYCDEYYYFATTDFPRFFAEARKFKVSTVIAHQGRYQLDGISKQATLNVANRIAFRVSGRDAQEMSHEFNYTPPQPFRMVVKDPLKVLFNKRHANDTVNGFVAELKRMHEEGEELERLGAAVVEAGKDWTQRNYWVKGDPTDFSLKRKYVKLMEKFEAIYGCIIRLEESAECPEIGSELKYGVEYIGYYIRDLMAGEIQMSSQKSYERIAGILWLTRRIFGMGAPILKRAAIKAGPYSGYYDIPFGEYEIESLGKFVEYQKKMEKQLELIAQLTVNYDSKKLDEAWDEASKMAFPGVIGRVPDRNFRRYMRDFAEKLVSVVRTLIADPIYETSVVGEPKVDPKDADIVAFLTNVDKYIARARIQVGDAMYEGTIRTSPPPPNNNRAVTDLVIAATRRQYTQPQETIISQIRSRQSTTLKSLPDPTVKPPARKSKPRSKPKLSAAESIDEE